MDPAVLSWLICKMCYQRGFPSQFRTGLRGGEGDRTFPREDASQANSEPNLEPGVTITITCV